MSGINRKKCCCNPKLYMQWRRCDTGALAPLWSEPSWPEGVAPGTWPQYMLFAGDGKCYKRLGTEPTSTNPPTDQIIYVIAESLITGFETEIDWAHLFFIHPEGKDCSYVICAPGPCGVCTGNDKPTPSAFVAIFSGITMPTGCQQISNAPCCSSAADTEWGQLLTNPAAPNRVCLLTPGFDGFGDPVSCFWRKLKREILVNWNILMCPGCVYPPDCDGPLPVFVDAGGEFDDPVNSDAILDGSQIYQRIGGGVTGAGPYFLFSATLPADASWCNKILTLPNELGAFDLYGGTWSTGGQVKLIPVGVPLAA